MRFAELIAPLPVDRFMSEIYGRRPVHLKADTTPRALPLDWPRLSQLLAVRSHWTQANIRLIMDSRPLFPDLYMDATEKQGERLLRANPAKVHTFMSMGASMVGNAVEDVSPDVRAIAIGLSEQFSARAGANVYCSFKDVQAFASHCDLHEVFAVQCEGEKTWNIYENRAASPVQALEGDDAQATIDAVKGRILMQVRMQPGDVLYIPRGFYHDALASSSASLHVTFGVAPLTGLSLFGLLEKEAQKEEAFRDYLPAAGQDDAALRSRLEALSSRIAELLKSDRIAAEVANLQRQSVEPDFAVDLPRLATLSFYARSDVPAQLKATDASTMLESGRGTLHLLHLAAAAEWMLSRPAFSVQELVSRFAYLDSEALQQLLAQLVQMGLFYPFQPQR